LIDSELPRFFAGAQNDRGTGFFTSLLESNPTATGAAPDGNKLNLPKTILGLPELGRHRLPAAGQTPLRLRVDFRRRESCLGSTPT
jgi:hypothetical protein